MSDLAVKVSNLSKRYQLGAGLPQHGLRELIQERVVGLWNRNSASVGSLKQSIDSSSDFWALRDLNFEIGRGEVVGVIGRNGAGKSTLLKILSRITEPTSGRVELHGRVGSLLEVGTGFHPELTGRENIFLNGAILGMSQAEIRRNLDAIVDFSGIEKFLDTPVKRYSSGMYVRLAFAVAAHLQPEILIVDEVLAVGDAEFQAKCLGKMQDVAQHGRTVLFVSHNLAAVQALCQRALLLEQGALVEQGDPGEVIAAYLRRSRTLASQELSTRSDRNGTGKLRFTGVRFSDPDGETSDGLQTGRPGTIELHIENRIGEELRGIEINLGISDEVGTRVCLLGTGVSSRESQAVPSSGGICRFELPKVPLVAGRYQLTLFANVQGEVADWVIDAAELNVVEGDFFGTGRGVPPGQGKLLVEHRSHFVAAGVSA